MFQKVDWVLRPHSADGIALHDDSLFVRQSFAKNSYSIVTAHPFVEQMHEMR
jgi:hypothetical protein